MSKKSIGSGRHHSSNRIRRSSSQKRASSAHSRTCSAHGPCSDAVNDGIPDFKSLSKYLCSECKEKFQNKSASKSFGQPDSRSSKDESHRTLMNRRLPAGFSVKTQNAKGSLSISDTENSIKTENSKRRLKRTLKTTRHSQVKKVTSKNGNSNDKSSLSFDVNNVESSPKDVQSGISTSKSFRSKSGKATYVYRRDKIAKLLTEIVDTNGSSYEVNNVKSGESTSKSFRSKPEMASDKTNVNRRYKIEQLLAEIAVINKHPNSIFSFKENTVESSPKDVKSGELTSKRLRSKLGMVTDKTNFNKSDENVQLLAEIAVTDKQPNYSLSFEENTVESSPKDLKYQALTSKPGTATNGTNVNTNYETEQLPTEIAVVDEQPNYNLSFKENTVESSPKDLKYQALSSKQLRSESGTETNETNANRNDEIEQLPTNIAVTDQRPNYNLSFEENAVESSPKDLKHRALASRKLRSALGTATNGTNASRKDEIEENIVEGNPKDVKSRETKIVRSKSGAATDKTNVNRKDKINKQRTSKSSQSKSDTANNETNVDRRDKIDQLLSAIVECNEVVTEGLALIINQKYAREHTSDEQKSEIEMCTCCHCASCGKQKILYKGRQLICESGSEEWNSPNASSELLIDENVTAVSNDQQNKDKSTQAEDKECICGRSARNTINEEDTIGQNLTETEPAFSNEKQFIGEIITKTSDQNVDISQNLTNSEKSPINGEDNTLSDVKQFVIEGSADDKDCACGISPLNACAEECTCDNSPSDVQQFAIKDIADDEECTCDESPSDVQQFVIKVITDDEECTCDDSPSTVQRSSASSKTSDVRGSTDNSATNPVATKNKANIVQSTPDKRNPLEKSSERSSSASKTSSAKESNNENVPVEPSAVERISTASKTSSAKDSNDNNVPVEQNSTNVSIKKNEAANQNLTNAEETLANSLRLNAGTSDKRQSLTSRSSGRNSASSGRNSASSGRNSASRPSDSTLPNDKNKAFIPEANFSKRALCQFCLENCQKDPSVRNSSSKPCESKPSEEENETNLTKRALCQFCLEHCQSNLSCMCLKDLDRGNNNTKKRRCSKLSNCNANETDTQLPVFSSCLSESQDSNQPKCEPDNFQYFDVISTGSRRSSCSKNISNNARCSLPGQRKMSSGKPLPKKYQCINEVITQNQVTKDENIKPQCANFLQINNIGQFDAVQPQPDMNKEVTNESRNFTFSHCMPYSGMAEVSIRFSVGEQCTESQNRCSNGKLKEKLDFKNISDLLLDIKSLQCKVAHLRDASVEYSSEGNKRTSTDSGNPGARRSLSGEDKPYTEVSNKSDYADVLWDELESKSFYVDALSIRSAESKCNFADAKSEASFLPHDKDQYYNELLTDNN